MVRRLRHACLGLALGMGLSLATAGVSVAAPEPVAAQGTSMALTTEAACPWAEGTRLKKTTEGRVYLIGPNYTLFWIPSPTEYNNLWGGWDGIFTVPDAQFDGCFKNPSSPMYGAQLAKLAGNPTVYIYVDLYGGWLPIKDWSTFTNKYNFDPSKIHTFPSLYPILSLHWT